MLQRKIEAKLLLFIGILGFLFLIALTIYHSQPPLFDEPYFVANVHLFQKEGLTRDFLVNLQDQAPGPLYELVHYSLSPLTGLQTPGIRLVNVFLLGMTILVLAKILVLTRKMPFGEAFLVSLGMVAVPMVWQVSGMALTEMPTMFFSVLSVLLLVLTLQNEENPLKGSLLAIAAGLSAGLAILGRSPFLVLSLCSAVLLMGNFNNAKRWRTLFLFNLCALSISVPIFLIWKGLVPPQQAYVGNGFSLWHGILAYAYAAFLTVIIAPRWFFFNRRILLSLVLCYFVFLGINYFIAHYEYAPLDKTMDRVLPASMMKIYPLLISPLLATLSFYFIACTLYHGWQKRADLVFLFILFTGLLLLASSFKVTHLFSTRYVAQAAPFFVLLFPGFDRLTVARVLRFVVGMGIGFLSLETYFKFH